jgi:hypothetical protein
MNRFHMQIVYAVNLLTLAAVAVGRGAREKVPGP